MWPVLALLGVSSAGFAFGAVRQMPLRLRIRVLGLVALATGVAIAIGGEPGLVLVCVVMPLQIAAMQHANRSIATAARSSDPAALRRSWRFASVAFWPDGGPGLRSLELLMLERMHRFPELRSRVTRMMASDDAEDVVLATPWAPDPSAGVGAATALLERDFERYAAGALPIVAAVDPARCIDLVERHFSVFEAFGASLWPLSSLLCIGGRVDAVTTLCDVIKPSNESRQATLLRALAASDRVLDYERAKAEAARDENPRLRHLAARAEGSTAARAALSPRQIAVIDRAELLVRERAEVDAVHDVEAAAARGRRPLMTYGFALACLAGFAAELANGSTTDDRVLARSGALVVVDRHVVGGWWRVVSATFLHAGLAHLSLNLLVFVVLGSQFERRFGRAAVAGIWLLGALGGGLAVLAASGGASEVVVGASTSIMALIGALVGAALRQWRRTRSTASRALFLRLAAVVALQALIDQLIPQVSAAGHAGGFVAGFTAMVVIGPRFERT